MSGSDDKRKPQLRIVKSEAETEAKAQVPESKSAETQASLDASAVLGNAVMYSAMSWVACCMEQQGEAVSVMPLGGGLFDAEVRLVGGRSIWLRVRLILEAGPVLTSRVEPVHP